MPKVLLVDDEQGGLRESGGALEAAGFEVTVVTSARAALRLVETRLYVVVGCEFDLGEMSGVDFLNKASLAAPGTGLMLVATSEQMRVAKESKDEREPTRRPSSETRVPGLRVMLRPFDAEQLVSNVQHLARMAEMRRSTHAMTSVVGTQEEESPTSRAPSTSDRPPPPRSMFPRK
jgi:DNA-binding NtrC family response regulator